MALRIIKFYASISERMLIVKNCKVKNLLKLVYLQSRNYYFYYNILKYMIRAINQY